jgi:hypothetical protein
MAKATAGPCLPTGKPDRFVMRDANNAHLHPQETRPFDFAQDKLASLRRAQGRRDDDQV